MHTRAHKVTWYGKSGDQLKENEVKWNERFKSSTIFTKLHVLWIWHDIQKKSAV